MRPQKQIRARKSSGKTSVLSPLTATALTVNDETRNAKFASEAPRERPEHRCRAPRLH